MSLLAIDMGSSSCKGVLFALDGQALAEAQQSYSPDISKPCWAEMPPEKFWTAFCAVAGTLARKAETDPVDALAISSHAETFIPVDDQGRAVAPALLNIDNRATAEANWLRSALDPKRVFEITGLAIHPMYPVPKLLWMRTHQPDVFRAATRFLAVPSYLLTRLGVRALVDYSLASRFLAFDIRTKRWANEILSVCDLDSDRFPEPVPAGTVAGYLSSEVAVALGLPRGIPVVMGGHDQPCAALGMGVVDVGRVSASLGTYECLLTAAEAPATQESAYEASLNTYCHVVPDRYVTLAYFPSGIMIDWFLRLLQGDRHEDEFAVQSVCAKLEACAPPGPTGLLITPHLLGTCNPDFDPNATGVISGLRPASGAAHIYKGILEGIACEFAIMAELLQRVSGQFRDVYITGGGSRSQLGLDLRAAISGCRLHRVRSPEAVCLGTAILAGMGAGKYSSYREAIAQAVRVAGSVEPDAGMAEGYAGQLRNYRLLYSSLAPLRKIPATSALQGEP